MKLKLDIGTILTLTQVIPSIVKSVQRALGKEPGAVRKAAAMEAATSAVALVNGLANREALSPAVIALVDEAIEIGVQQKKLVERMQQIDELVRASRGAGVTSAADATGVPV